MYQVMQQIKQYALLLGVGVILFGCQHAPVQSAAHDGPPRSSMPLEKLASLPDPIPTPEPYSKYGNPASYQALGRTYKVWDSHLGYREEGVASWYGTKFHGKRTSSGEPYDMFAMTAAHKNLPIPSYVKVTNLDNQKSVIVRVNDRGPFKDTRIIDLSYAAAAKLDILSMGTGHVKVEAIDATGDGQWHADPAKTLYVQVAAFSSPDHAEALVSKLKSHTDKPVQIQSNRSMYHVRVGPFGSNAEVSQFNQILSRLNLGQGFVVR